MNLLKRMKRIISLPTVVELGWADSNALPIRRFQPGVQGLTWEDYHREMKEKYPIRYFLSETLCHFFVVNIVMPMRELKWYVRDTLIRRTHMLDLRQDSWVDGCDDYRGGYLDPSSEVLYACMNSLSRFILETNAPNHLEWLESQLISGGLNDCDRPVLEGASSLFREAITIYKWWNVERKSDFIRLSNERAVGFISPEAKSAHYARWEAFEAQEDEMLTRLIKIRRGLWN